jgi:hypothetical protein
MARLKSCSKDIRFDAGSMQDEKILEINEKFLEINEKILEINEKFLEITEAQTRIKSRFIFTIIKYLKYLIIGGRHFSECLPPNKNYKKEDIIWPV